MSIRIIKIQTSIWRHENGCLLTDIKLTRTDRLNVFVCETHSGLQDSVILNTEYLFQTCHGDIHLINIFIDSPKTKEDDEEKDENEEEEEEKKEEEKKTRV